MKKILSLVLALLMVFSLLSLAGCGEKVALKLGLGTYSVIEEIKNADGESNGSGEAVITMAAVLVDENGKIVKCAIDTAANEIAFNSKGEYVTAGNMQTKYEAGSNYGMKTYAGSAKEWFEQVDAFVALVEGKTIDEVKAMEKDGKGNDEVIAAGCTIYISEFIKALEKAVSNASESNATADDVLKLGVVSTQTDNMNATEEANGVNEISTTVVAVATNGNKDITAAKTDAVAPKIEFDINGASSTEYGKEITSKRDAGDNYGMKAYAGAAKEWYEQADEFDAKLIGKTVEDIGTFADDAGKPNDELVTAGCTINVLDMVKAAIKAATIA